MLRWYKRGSGAPLALTVRRDRGVGADRRSAARRYALLEAWTAPWTWPVRPPADRGAWICSCAVFAAGLSLVTIRGPRSLSDNS
jgi:hypothetical protein